MQSYTEKATTRILSFITSDQVLELMTRNNQYREEKKDRENPHALHLALLFRFLSLLPSFQIPIHPLHPTMNVHLFHPPPVLISHRSPFDRFYTYPVFPSPPLMCSTCLCVYPSLLPPTTTNTFYYLYFHSTT